MLTALGSVDDVVKGFNIGADDYITKPFTFKELMARIEAVFRRVDWMRQPPPSRVIVNGEHPRRRRHAPGVGGRAGSTPDPDRVLAAHYLMSRPGQTVSKENLFREVWGYDFAGGTNLVEVGIRRLREKIEPDASNPDVILTVRGVGYKFRVPAPAR